MWHSPSLPFTFQTHKIRITHSIGHTTGSATTYTSFCQRSLGNTEKGDRKRRVRPLPGARVPRLTMVIACCAHPPSGGAPGDRCEQPRRVPLSKNELGKGRLKGTDGYVFVKPLKPQTYMTKWEGP